MIETITVRPPPTRPAATAPTIGRPQAAMPKMTPAPPAQTAPAGKAGLSLWDDDGFGFGDFLDAVNPLQHIPVLGALYREFVGDDIGTIPKLVGGALFSGIPGLIGAAVDATFEAVSGKDLGTTALALVGLGQNGEPDGKAPIVLASGGQAKTGRENIPTLTAAQFEIPLALPAQATPAQTTPMPAQNFAARFDYETSMYRHGQRLLSQNTPSLETNA